MTDVKLLRDLVAMRLNADWTEWSRRHPHLSGAIDRTRLIETAVTSLANDPQFVAAMRQADLDTAKLNAAARVFQLIEQALRRSLAG